LRSADLRILKLAKQFAKQIPSYLKAPKRHLNLYEPEIITTQNAIWPIFAMQYASQWYHKLSYLTWQKLNNNFIQIFVGKKWRRGRVLTNAALRPGMPPWPSLWVVFGTNFTRLVALRSFNGGSPTSSTTDWHLASFSTSAFRSWSDLPDFLAFLVLASYSVISFSCLAAFSRTSDW
jgi:hypothetical protein